MTHHRHPSSRRKPEEKKDAEDIFVEKILGTIDWARANSQVLVLVGIAAVILLSGAWYYRNYRVSVRQQAIAELEQVQQAVGFGDRETAKADLYRYLERFEDSPYAMEARLVLGQVLLEDNDVPAAIDVLAPAVQGLDDQPVGLQAASLLASAYEQGGQLDEAERLFVRIADVAEMGFQIREALAAAARIRAQNGDFEGAAELYRDALATLEEGDPERPLWEMRLAEVTFRD
jgi:predicted negative regulator of RcsB-dependent stress response